MESIKMVEYKLNDVSLNSTKKDKIAEFTANQIISFLIFLIFLKPGNYPYEEVFLIIS
jgi:hypothetical protein